MKFLRFRRMMRLIFYVMLRLTFTKLPQLILLELPSKLSRFLGNRDINKLGARLWKSLLTHKLKYGPLVSRSIVLALTHDGSKLYCPLGDICIIGDIYLVKVYDKFFEPNEGFTIVDVGAHVGIYTIKAARKVGKRGLIVSIEPHPYNYKLLTENLRMNSLDQNIIPINIALANFKGKTRLYLGPSPMAHSLLPVSEKWIEVKVNTLDGVMEELDLKHCDLLKIDVEGYELEVLKGAENILKNTSMVTVAAYHTVGEAEIVQAFLKSYTTLCNLTFKA